MADCFVCKHPILEGQKHFPVYEEYVLDMEAPEVVGVAHANPADHLPTMAAEHGHWSVCCYTERERAAKIVEEFVFWHTARQIAEEDEGDRMDRLKSEMAERIRNGD